MTKTRKQLLVGIQARSSAKNRSWSLEKMKQLIILLSQHPLFKVIVFDIVKNDTDAAAVDRWNLAGVEPFVNFGIRQTAAMINELDLIITLDSGLMHIAGALGVPNLAIFGGTDPGARTNHYPNTTAISRSHLSCHPCWYDTSACGGSLSCINSITVDEVFNVALSLASNAKKKKKAIVSALPQIENKKAIDLCIIRDDGIGDLVSCLPSFSAFRKAYPRKRIALATLARNRELMRLSGCFDEVIPLSEKWTEIRQEGQMYDARDLFEKYKEDGKIGCYHEKEPRPLAMARFLGVEPDLKYAFSKDTYSMDQARALLDRCGIKHGKDKIAVVQLEATCTARSWLKDYFKFLPRLLQEEGFIPVALGSKYTKDFDVYPCINLTGQTTIMQFNAVVALSNVFIGVDSGGNHLAAANNIPFVALCNSIDPELRFWNYKGYRAIYPKSLDCVPCWDRGCGPMKCMKMMRPQIVMEALKDLVQYPEKADIIYL
jgi:ADP-heptose:LPS heptosyltransferase